jgi:hypothetical protein
VLKIKVDNDDGTINWAQRARLVVAIAKMLHQTKKQMIASMLLPGVSEPDPKFVKRVSKVWDTWGKRHKRHHSYGCGKRPCVANQYVTCKRCKQIVANKRKSV